MSKIQLNTSTTFCRTFSKKPFSPYAINYNHNTCYIQNIIPVYINRCIDSIRLKIYILIFSWVPGHSCTLQLSVMLDDPVHSSPPCCASTFGTLVFVRIPPPHGSSHSPVCHSSHSQSTNFANKFDLKITL